MISNKMILKNQYILLWCFADSFRRRDTAQQGVVNFPYDDVSLSKFRTE